jgi:hypothetical protein
VSSLRAPTSKYTYSTASEPVTPVVTTLPVSAQPGAAMSSAQPTIAMAVAIFEKQVGLLHSASYALATSSTSLPKFSPLNSFISDSGKVLMPTTTSSLLFIRPSFKYPAISAIARW